jgi:hypothetical protein
MAALRGRARDGAQTVGQAEGERLRVIFEENSGLALVHPVDYIEATIEQHAAGRRAPAPGQAAAEGI